ncbi:MAG TPA: threonine/serine exporter family protein [Caproicibacter sp.]|nr:threonine/serine exporter family protein [Caproicibacter sp.]
MSKSQKILNLAVAVGEELLKNGAEIYRVQDTIIHIIEAFGITDYNVYVISNGIFATVNENQEDAHSSVRHVPLGNVNLNRIAEINQLSRDLCGHSMTVEKAYDVLDQSCKTKCNPFYIQVLSYGMGSACFCYLFGGSVFDSLAAFILGVVLGVYSVDANRRRKSKFVSCILGSAIVTAGSILFSRGFAISTDKVIIGAIIPLVPGVSFTTSVREFFNGDYLSGSIHLIDALLIAACIAIGVGASMQCYHFLGGKL